MNFIRVNWKYQAWGEAGYPLLRTSKSTVAFDTGYDSSELIMALSSAHSVIKIMFFVLMPSRREPHRLMDLLFTSINGFARLDCFAVLKWQDESVDGDTGGNTTQWETNGFSTTSRNSPKQAYFWQVHYNWTCPLRRNKSSTVWLRIVLGSTYGSDADEQRFRRWSLEKPSCAYNMHPVYSWLRALSTHQ